VLLLHQPVGRAAGHEDRVGVDRELSVKAFVCLIDDIGDPVSAGVVDEDVKAAVLGCDRSDSGLDTVLVGDI
jgi:hypothetical protein